MAAYTYIRWVVEFELESIQADYKYTDKAYTLYRVVLL